MNATLIGALLRQRLRSPVRMALLWTFFVFGVLPQFFAPHMTPSNQDWIWVLILGAGAVGQDVSAGVITGLLARPVRRAEYLASRWLAVGLGASAIGVLLCLAAAAVGALRHGGPEPADLAWRAGLGVLTCFGTSAVLVSFSACVNGLGDLGVFLLASMVGQLMSTVGAFKNLPWLVRAAEEAEHFLRPTLDSGQLWGPGFSWFAVVSYLSTVSLCLAVAVWVLNRREFSYAAGQS